MPQLVPDEIWVPERRPQDFDPLFRGTCFVASSPDPGMLQRQLGSSLQDIARLWPHTSTVPPLGCPSVHLDAGVLPKCIFEQCVNHTESHGTATSSRNAHSNFRGLNCWCTATRAGCWPRENKKASLHPLALHPHLGPPHARFPSHPPNQYVDGLP